jgi:hypothetical protein
LWTRAVPDVARVGFYGLCDPNSVQTVIGFRASDFSPEILASLFFPYSNEQNQCEGFANAAHALREQVDTLVRLASGKTKAAQTLIPCSGEAQEAWIVFSDPGDSP